MPHVYLKFRIHIHTKEAFCTPVLSMGSEQTDPLRDLVYKPIVYKGAMKNPSGHMGFTYPIQTDYLFEKGLQTLTD